MNNERFDDEILSAIIDGEADAETVAAVNADPAAHARLEQIRSAVSRVATPVPEASPQRRNASIAAALSAATPVPEVSSLAAARHTRATQPARSRSVPRWVAAAAAAVLLIVAIPLLSRFGGSDAADTATEAIGNVESPSFGLDEPADEVETADRASADAGDSSDDAVEEPQAAGATLDEELRDFQEDAMDQETTDADEASAADDAAPTPQAPAETDADRVVVSNLEILEEFILLGTVTPQLTADQVIAEGVIAACVEPFAVDDTALFDLVILDEFGGGARLILVIFDEDESTMALDAEDCAQLG